ncbi:kinetochore protein mis15 [Aspergillus awamori]|uniref:Kinetochore protein mis15 n=1 Tax=Aspergillus awamori TaxID=105351 RepID=A0A401KXE2_ASPAW|nr:kinetochore protein mis15 [Aspergillus awamori]GKZ52837.1 hypothetical protein AnigIFM49718_003489 [Aspergillus niger]
MARLKSVRAPTTASLPSNLRIPSSTPSLVKAFGKLTRQALLDLAFQWLDDRNLQAFPPYLQEDEDQKEEEDEGLSPYPAERTVNDVRNAYQELQLRKGGKREVIDRILEGDWRHGITLRQLAMVDLRYIDDHSSSLRWTALELSRIESQQQQQHQQSDSADLSACLPRVHASTFLSKLQQQIAPLVKAHYYLSRSTSLPLTFLRIFVTNSPYQHPRQAAELLTDSSRVIYIAFPDSCPYIYTSIASTPGSSKSSSASATPHAIATDPRSLQRLVRDALPKALSLPHQRYTLKPTSLTAKSLQALLSLRGPGRANQSTGAFSIFADAALEGSPLDPRPSSTVTPEEHMNHPSHHKENQHPDDADTSTSKPPKRSNTDHEDPHVFKKRTLTVQSRFGTSASLSSAPLDRLDIRLLDPPTPTSTASPSSSSSSTPTLSLTFTGTDVISGFRKLAETGIINAEKMPSWMTGEEAVSVAAVRRGRRVVKDSG